MNDRKRFLGGLASAIALVTAPMLASAMVAPSTPSGQVATILQSSGVINPGMAAPQIIQVARSRGGFRTRFQNRRRFRSSTNFSGRSHNSRLRSYRRSSQRGRFRGRSAPNRNVNVHVRRFGGRSVNSNPRTIR